MRNGVGISLEKERRMHSLYKEELDSRLEHNQKEIELKRSQGNQELLYEGFH